MKVSLLLLSLCLLLSTVGYTQAKSSLDLVLGADSGYRYLGTDGESADMVANVRNEKEAAMPGWRVGGSYNKRVGFRISRDSSFLPAGRDLQINY